MSRSLNTGQPNLVKVDVYLTGLVRCCQGVPAGLFCLPDQKNLTEKEPADLNNSWDYCQWFALISGIDEMALTCEMGLYFDFQNRDGFPTGCPGFEEFDGSQTEYWRQAGERKRELFSMSLVLLLGLGVIFPRE